MARDSEATGWKRTGCAAGCGAAGGRRGRRGRSAGALGLVAVVGEAAGGAAEADGDEGAVAVELLAERATLDEDLDLVVGLALGGEVDVEGEGLGDQGGELGALAGVGDGACTRSASLPSSMRTAAMSLSGGCCRLRTW
jgi:hypothetical protein